MSAFPEQSIEDATRVRQAECEVELIEDVPNTSPRRYRVADSDVVRECFELNSALNSVGG
ncbi:hypothetical protein DVK08_05630 [Halorubrum sp. Atlit-9R]|nr:hypothetical protein DVK08_05630 [Halorubrum sp. Atlit-9R]